MISFLINKIQEHPNEVGETYWEHFRHALSFSSRLLFAAGACLLHAIVPFCCKTTGSSAVRKLHSSMVTNRLKPAIDAEKSNVIGVSSGRIPSGLNPETEA